MNARTLAGHERRSIMTWFDRHLPRSKEETRRAENVERVTRSVDALIQELREEVRQLQEAGEDHRKGYPVENALRRRRPTHD